MSSPTHSYKFGSYQLIKILPVILSHESKQRQEGPAECVKARVAVIGVSPSLHTDVPFWTLSVKQRNNGGGVRGSVAIPTDHSFFIEIVKSQRYCL